MWVEQTADRKNIREKQKRKRGKKMTLKELSEELNAMPEHERDKFLRDIRMLWATGKATIDDYEKESEESNE